MQEDRSFEVKALGETAVIRARTRSQAMYRAFKQWQSASGGCAIYWSLPDFAKQARIRLARVETA
jgi:hypothetical protein